LGVGAADHVLLEVASARIGRSSADAKGVGVLDLVAGVTGATDQGSIGGDVARKSEDGDSDKVLDWV
jgi:hypothetical protein